MHRVRVNLSKAAAMNTELQHSLTSAVETVDLQAIQLHVSKPEREGPSSTMQKGLSRLSLFALRQVLSSAWGTARLTGRAKPIIEPTRLLKSEPHPLETTDAVPDMPDLTTIFLCRINLASTRKAVR